MGGEAPRNPAGPPPGRPAIGAVEAADQLQHHQRRKMEMSQIRRSMIGFTISIPALAKRVRLVALAN